MYDHDDPTAWIAIANVERERKRKEREARKKKPKEKPEYVPKDPADWHKILASPNKKIHINRAWKFYSEVVKQIESGKKT